MKQHPLIKLTTLKKVATHGLDFYTSASVKANARMVKRYETNAMMFVIINTVLRTLGF